MSSKPATARIAASETHPSCCSWTRHRIAITADAWRPGGYFAISCFAQARFSSENVKLSGCNSFGARRRTDIVSLSLQAACGVRVQGIEAVLPEYACGAEDVVADMGGNLDAVEDRQLSHGFHALAARVVDDQLQRLLFENIARYGVPPVVAVLLAQQDTVALQQPRAALDGFDLDAFDVELDQVFSIRRDLAVVEQIVERDDRHVFAVGRVACNAERLMLGAGKMCGA